jgi:hypothetical protein
MPTTIWVHRLIMVVPAAAWASVGSWFQANIDANDNLSTWPRLNATGVPTDPLTHCWSHASYTEGLARTLLVRVCNLAGVTPPTLGQWNDWNKPQKYAWLSATRAQFYAQTGLWLDLADNDWDDPTAALDALGLKQLVVAGGA